MIITKNKHNNILKEFKNTHQTRLDEIHEIIEDQEKQIESIVDRLSNQSLKVFSSCKHWLRTVPSLPADPKRVEDIDTSAEDHLFDATRYGLMLRRARSVKPKPKAKGPKPFTMEWLDKIDELYDRDDPWQII